MGDYHVNNDPPENKAVIHKETCGHAMARKKNLEDGEWHGPYDSFEAAYSVAQSLGRREVILHRTSRCVNDPSPFST